MISALPDPSRLAEIDAIGGRRLLASLLQRFTESNATDIPRLESSIEGLDFATVRQLVHRLEGACAAFGAGYAVELCHELRNYAKLGSQAESRDACLRLVAELHHVERALTHHLEGPAEP